MTVYRFPSKSACLNQEGAGRQGRQGRQAQAGAESQSSRHRSSQSNLNTGRFVIGLRKYPLEKNFPIFHRLKTQIHIYMNVCLVSCNMMY
jgi:hypothetical protein